MKNHEKENDVRGIMGREANTIPEGVRVPRRSTASTSYAQRQERSDSHNP